MEWVTVPILAHQNIGAMIVFVLFGLWMGRSHLRVVVRKAFRDDASVQDTDEVMSYRTAVFLVLGGNGFMMWWLWMSGLALWVTGMVLFIAFVLFLGLTRMVTEGGFFTTRAPMNPGNFMVSGFGVETLGASGVTALGYIYDRGKPFFIGLVIGQFACMGCWLIIDYFTGMTGNVVYRLSGD